MKALQKVQTRKPKEEFLYKVYQYTGNKLVNDTPKPTGRFIQFKNEDLYNKDLADNEFRLLLAIISHKPDTKISVPALAKKFGRKERAIERTLESLIQKQYIHISIDKHLIIRRLGINDIPKPIVTPKEQLDRDLQEFNEIFNST